MTGEKTIGTAIEAATALAIGYRVRSLHSVANAMGIKGNGMR